MNIVFAQTDPIGNPKTHRATEQFPQNRIATRFGPSVDVRNRGALRSIACLGSQVELSAQLAVVRIWSGESCRELSAHEARALAAQLNEAAFHAETQNGN